MLSMGCSTKPIISNGNNRIYPEMCIKRSATQDTGTCHDRFWLWAAEINGMSYSKLHGIMSFIAMHKVSN